jgi:hypothetical protein
MARTLLASKIVRLPPCQGCTPIVPFTSSQLSGFGHGWPAGQLTGNPTGVASARQQRTSNLAISGAWPGTANTKPLTRTGSPAWS